jgi:diketogulonate reductase-like aldo/keto reductase
MATAPDQPVVVLDRAGPMPLLGLGTWQMTGARCQAAVRSALEVGYRHLDTAAMYRNERDIGRAVRDSGVPREQVFVTTKLPPGDAGRERRTLDNSLRALDMDYVDLWLVHWPPRDRALVPTWKELLAVRDEGLARAVGVSNYRIAQLDGLTTATGEAPQVNQIPWAPSRYDAVVLAEHRRRGVVLEGYSPFKNTDLRHPVLTEIAARHGVTPAQVVLRWHLDHQVVVIPKSATPSGSPPISTFTASRSPTRSWAASTGCRPPVAGSGCGSAPSGRAYRARVAAVVVDGGAMRTSCSQRDPDRALLGHHGHSGRPEPEAPRGDLIGLGVDGRDGAVQAVGHPHPVGAEGDPAGAVAHPDLLGLGGGRVDPQHRVAAAAGHPDGAVAEHHLVGG